MTRPSFQFYPADWRSNLKLRRCSVAARGSWMDILCSLHDSDEYGIVRWPLSELANAAGVTLKLVRELADKDVLKGGDSNVAPYIHIPRHAGKDGKPVTLVERSDGPVWYSSRMVRDEWRRGIAGASSRFTAGTKPSTLPETMPRQGEMLGDGSTSSASSSPAVKNSELRSEAHKRGSRWPSDALVCSDWLLEAEQKRRQLGLSEIDLHYQADRFANHWASKAGRDALKVDWKKTWMNWATIEKMTGKPNGKRTSHDSAIEGAFLAARDFDASHGSGTS